MVFVLLLLLLPSVGASPMSASEKQEMLRLHNKARQETGAADMTEIVWDDALERDAQNYANRCPSDHADVDQGENLAWGWPSRSVADSMNGWVDEEIGYFRYGSHRWCHGGACGHYTQIVWAKSTRLGCARRSGCRGMMGMGSPGDAYVCRFAPAGNMMGRQPYELGEPCSNCPSGYTTCRNGLCSKGGGSGSTGGGSDGGPTAKTYKCPGDVSPMADMEGNGEYSQRCAFPFLYKGVQYSGCTNTDHDQPWCALKVDGSWGNCRCETPSPGSASGPGPTTATSACPPSQLVADTMGNGDFSAPCVFPFTYKSVTYNACTKEDDQKPWCAVEVDDEGYLIKGRWGHCSCAESEGESEISTYKCPRDASPVVDTQGDGDHSERCAFPFVYKGVRYSRCTDADHDKPWCALEVDENSRQMLQDRWGNCSCQR